MITKSPAGSEASEAIFKGCWPVEQDDLHLRGLSVNDLQSPEGQDGQSVNLFIGSNNLF